MGPETHSILIRGNYFMLKALGTHWTWLSANPVAAITVISASVAAGFVVGRFLSKEATTNLEARIALLKESLDDKTNKLKELSQELANRTTVPALSVAEMQFPDHGIHGANILSALTLSTRVEQRCSMHAVIPVGQRLRIRIKQMSGKRTDREMMGAWTFRVPPRNWQHQTYDSDHDEQMFDAAAGDAEMNIAFKRPGTVRIQAFTASSQTPLWEKFLDVRQEPSG